ncbi:hypothetical protein QAD02_000106 [Eretmocerus hayati]|uniref:Uncharacterized protein n=1 Tax=Eretmocerus hayati TaxID=131215 RepID=A0ACC2NF09_9HYME|nr:hypothetical protein QAD02_000106 [Eretmocerus hayati]
MVIEAGVVVAEVISVSIKERPSASSYDSHHDQSSNLEILHQALSALKLNSNREKLIRSLQQRILTRNSNNLLRQHFQIWRNYKSNTLNNDNKNPSRILSANSSDARSKIEILVGAIAQEQKRVHESQGGAGDAPGVSKGGIKGEGRVGRVVESDRLRKMRERQEQRKLERLKRLQERKKIEEERRVKEKGRIAQLDREAKKATKETIDAAKKALGQCELPRNKRAIVHRIRQQGCRDESVAELHRKLPTVATSPGFLQRMEARAEARKLRIKQADELRQRKRDEEKKRLEARQRQAEEEQRLQHIQAMKEAVKQRREHEAKRLKEIEKAQELENRADNFYQRLLLRRYVLEPLKLLVSQKADLLTKADRRYQEILLLKILTAWRKECLERRETKLNLASKLYRHNLLWYTFDDWRNSTLESRRKFQVACDFSEMRLLTHSFQHWHELCRKIRKAESLLETKADRHFGKKLKKRYLELWRRYLTIADDVKQREMRRDEWRNLIRKFIPRKSEIQIPQLQDLDQCVDVR